MQTETASSSSSSKRDAQNRILDSVALQIGNLAEFAAEYGLGDIDHAVLLETLDNAMKRACGPKRWDLRLSR